jgi:hypothetical protein
VAVLVAHQQEHFFLGLVDYRPRQDIKASQPYWVDYESERHLHNDTGIHNTGKKSVR